MLRVISGNLASAGHTVSVITAQPSHKTADRKTSAPGIETLDGVRVKRLRLLAGARSSGLLLSLNKALFPARAFFHTLIRFAAGERQDIIIAATMPPVANGFFAYLAAKITGAKFIYHMQDIYPEIASVSGIWSNKSLLYRLLLRADKWIAKKADRVIVLSDDMAKSISLRDEKIKLTVINNFALDDFDSDLIESKQLEKSDRTRLIFAGNIGRFQALEQIVDAFKSLNYSSFNAELHFVGDGVRKKSLEALSEDCDRIIFHGQLPYRSTTALIDQSDMALVTLTPEIHKYAYPSKTLTYMSMGIPMLALVESHSSLAHDILTNNMGVVTTDRSTDGIRHTIETALSAIESNKFSRYKIRQHYTKFYSANAHTNKWKSVISALVNPEQTRN